MNTSLPTTPHLTMMNTSQSFYAPPAPTDSAVLGYLPLNLRGTLNGASYYLARIDAVFRDDLLQYNWKSTPRGAVFRVFRDVPNTRDTGKSINHVELLALRLLDLEPYTPWHPANGDVLDLRLSNIKAGTAPEHLQRVEPASSFRDLPSYAAAAADRLQQRQAYAQLLRFGPAPRLNEDQVRTLLEAVRSDPLLRGATLVSISRWMRSRFGVGFYPSFLLRVLRGDALHVRGFDYGSILAIRKSRVEVARKHWRFRRYPSVATSTMKEEV